MKTITDLLDRLGALIFGTHHPEPEQPALNRAQRRALDKMKPGELRMRRERTYIAQAKRRSSSKGDHGAKARRAYKAGVDAAVRYLNVRIQSAYVQGLKEGRAQKSWWTRTRSRLHRPAADGGRRVTATPSGKTAAS